MPNPSIICDIDGTLFNGDSPVQEVIDYLKDESMDHDVIIISGRQDSQMQATRNLLNAHDVPHSQIHLSDFPKGAEVQFKKYKAKKLMDEGYDIIEAIDNDARTRDAYSSLEIEEVIDPVDIVKEYQDRQSELDTESNNRMKLLTIENRVAKVRLNDAVTPWSADDLIADIERSYGQKAVAENMTVGTLQCSANDALETLEIEINSPGGSVLDGYRVYNSLMQMRGRGVEIIATVNTLAASMGSVILMAANKVRIVEGGRIMIHEASQAVAGDSATHARAAKLLDEISNEIAVIYAKRTGANPDQMRELMKAETWMGAAEAMDRKFADEIVKFDTQAKSMSLFAKLFPGNDEALKIEAAIAENDSLRADLVSAEARIKELSGHAEIITQLRAELATEQEKAVEVTEKAEELATKVKELEEKTEVSEEKVSARAAEMLASTGHPAPVALAGDTNEAPVSHLKAMATMTPAEAAEYFALHKAEILSDKNRYSV